MSFIFKLKKGWQIELWDSVFSFEQYIFELRGLIHQLFRLCGELVMVLTVQNVELEERCWKLAMSARDIAGEQSTVELGLCKVSSFLLCRLLLLSPDYDLLLELCYCFSSSTVLTVNWWIISFLISLYRKPEDRPRAVN